MERSRLILLIISTSILAFGARPISYSPSHNINDDDDPSSTNSAEAATFPFAHSNKYPDTSFNGGLYIDGDRHVVLAGMIDHSDGPNGFQSFDKMDLEHLRSLISIPMDTPWGDSEKLLPNAFSGTSSPPQGAVFFLSRSLGHVTRISVDGWDPYGFTQWPGEQQIPVTLQAAIVDNSRPNFLTIHVLSEAGQLLRLDGRDLSRFNETTDVTIPNRLGLFHDPLLHTLIIPYIDSGSYQLLVMLSDANEQQRVVSVPPSLSPDPLDPAVSLIDITVHKSTYILAWSNGQILKMPAVDPSDYYQHHDQQQLASSSNRHPSPVNGEALTLDMGGISTRGLVDTNPDTGSDYVIYGTASGNILKVKIEPLTYIGNVSLVINGDLDLVSPPLYSGAIDPVVSRQAVFGTDEYLWIVYLDDLCPNDECPVPTRPSPAADIVSAAVLIFGGLGLIFWGVVEATRVPAIAIPDEPEGFPN